MNKFNAIARRYRAAQRAEEQYPEDDMHDAPWLWMDYPNARRYSAYQKRRRQSMSNPHRRQSDQPITDDFTPGADEALITNTYIRLILVAGILLFIAWAAGRYFTR